MGCINLFSYFIENKIKMNSSGLICIKKIISRVFQKPFVIETKSTSDANIKYHLPFITDKLWLNILAFQNVLNIYIHLQQIRGRFWGIQNEQEWLEDGSSSRKGIINFRLNIRTKKNSETFNCFIYHTFSTSNEFSKSQNRICCSWFIHLHIVYLNSRLCYIIAIQ